MPCQIFLLLHKKWLYVDSVRQKGKVYVKEQGKFRPLVTNTGHYDDVLDQTETPTYIFTIKHPFFSLNYFTHFCFVWRLSACRI